MGTVDESLLSTASTLIDSCSTSLIEESFDDANYNTDVKPLLCRGKITDFPTEPIGSNNKKGHSKTKSPTTTAICLEITESATERSERSVVTTATTESKLERIRARTRMLRKQGSKRIKESRVVSATSENVSSRSDRSVATTATTESKLERIRARNSLLRKQGSQKIEESRASLRNSRTIAMESKPLSTLQPQPPPYPPPSLLNQAIEARIEQEEERSDMTSDDIKLDTNADFSEYLRRSNSVLDRLATEMAMAGSIINESLADCDDTFNDKTAHNRNDFTSNLCAQRYYFKTAREEKSIQNDENSIHNISVGDDWDNTTLSPSANGSQTSSALGSKDHSIKPPPPTRSMFSSGLPPPEVVVKKVTPRSSPRSGTPLDAQISFSDTTTSTFAPRTNNRRQKAPSVASFRGDCASMYNPNQKIEKLALENDCLKRQLDLLESRHRDSEKKLMERIHRTPDEEGEEDPHTGTIISLSSKKSRVDSVAYYRKKKKKRKRTDRLRIALFLLVAPFLLSSTVWFYRTVRNEYLARTMDSSATDGIDVASMMREGVLRQTGFGETLFSDNATSDTIQHEPITTEYEPEEELHEDVVVAHEVGEYREDEVVSGKKIGRFKRFFSRLKNRQRKQRQINSPVGVWLEKHRQVETKKHHAEL